MNGALGSQVSYKRAVASIIKVQSRNNRSIKRSLRLTNSSTSQSSSIKGHHCSEKSKTYNNTTVYTVSRIIITRHTKITEYATWTEIPAAINWYRLVESLQPVAQPRTKSPFLVKKCDPANLCYILKRAQRAASRLEMHPVLTLGNLTSAKKAIARTVVDCSKKVACAVRLPVGRRPWFWTPSNHSNRHFKPEINSMIPFPRWSLTPVAVKVCKWYRRRRK